MSKHHSQNSCQGQLFSNEELEACTPSSLFSLDVAKPVVCLGMEFADDDARRAYFRERLRELLPELRHIEGFPVGSDDDIINLSDPPYYNACPNPWLNDFIAQWEAEKQQLEAEGKRQPDFEVTEPYAADVSEGKNNPIYTAHTYHTKVPHPAIMRYILHYTQPGDIVFDGFAGTGMTGVAANCCRDENNLFAQKISNTRMGSFGQRHVICGDLSPYASFISYFYNSPIQFNELKTECHRIITELRNEYGYLYDVTSEGGRSLGRINFLVWSDYYYCPNCGEEYAYLKASLDMQKKKILDAYPCPKCGTIHSKKDASLVKTSTFDNVLNSVVIINKSKPLIIVYKNGSKSFERFATTADVERACNITFENRYNNIPKALLPDGQETKRNEGNGISYVHQFYQNRTLIVLDGLLEKINRSPQRAKLMFLFTGMIQRLSKMNRMHVSHYFNGGGGWNGGTMKGTLYVPNAPIETSVLEILEDRLSAIERIETFLAKKQNNLVFVGSATDVKVPAESIDYIFVDPPFGANIFYSELNYIVESWLKVVTNNNKEAIENKSQQKDSAFYKTAIKASFTNFYRVLKPGKWLTIEFSNTSASIWNILQTSLQEVGFIIANISALDKKQGSFNAVTTTTAVKQDLIISCFKPTERMLNLFNQATEPEKNVWDFVGELLEHLPVHIERKQKTTSVVERSPKILFDRLISYYVQRGFAVPIDAGKFQAGLRDRFVERDGMYFTAKQVAKYDEMRRTTEGFQASLFVVDSEQGGIAWLNNELDGNMQTYQDLQPKWMQAIQGVRKGDILPELKQILEENFIREEALGMWRRPNLQDDVDLEALRHKSLMREFKVYVEAANKPKGKIKEARVEALRAGFRQCYMDKQFDTIVKVGDRIPANLLQEDEVLLQFYDIALTKTNL